MTNLTFDINLGIRISELMAYTESFMLSNNTRKISCFWRSDNQCCAEFLGCGPSALASNRPNKDAGPSDANRGIALVNSANK